MKSCVEICRTYFCAKTSQKSMGFVQWWRVVENKKVVDPDILWRVVEPLLFLWGNARKIRLFPWKKYSENRYFGVVFLG